MRMDPTDLADVTGYTFLVNGRGPDRQLDRPVPARREGAAALHQRLGHDDVRCPHSRASSSRSCRPTARTCSPVDVDEFRIGVGETYDVIVEPREDRAYTHRGRSRSTAAAVARATLAPREGMAGPLPVLRPPGVLGMADMGHGSGGHGRRWTIRRWTMPRWATPPAAAPDTSGLVHVPPVDAPAGAKVLSYTDLKRLDRSYALNPPDRTIDIRLTGNMEKFIWSFDDRKYSEQPVINFTAGRDGAAGLQERDHDEPSDPSARALDGPRQRRGRGAAAQARGDRAARPHRRVTVQMAEVGRWPFHCHFLFHMMTGMFREFVVHPRGTRAAGGQAAMRPSTGGGHAHH